MRQPLGSIGTPARRWLTIATSATTSAPTSGSSSAPKAVPKQTLLPASGNSSVRVGRQRARPVTTTTGSGSTSTTTASAASTACGPGLGDDGRHDVADEADPFGGEHRAVEGRRAASGRTGTRPVPSRRRRVVHGQHPRHAAGRLDVHRAPTVPWAIDERTNTMWAAPGDSRSSRYLACAREQGGILQPYNGIAEN